MVSKESTKLLEKEKGNLSWGRLFQMVVVSLECVYGGNEGVGSRFAAVAFAVDENSFAGVFDADFRNEGKSTEANVGREGIGKNAATFSSTAEYIELLAIVKQFAAQGKAKAFAEIGVEIQSRTPPWTGATELIVLLEFVAGHSTVVPNREVVRNTEGGN